MTEEQKTIQEQQKTINDMKNVLSYLLTDVPGGVLVMLTLNEIIKLAGQNT